MAKNPCPQLSRNTRTFILRDYGLVQCQIPRSVSTIFQFSLSSSFRLPIEIRSGCVASFRTMHRLAAVSCSLLAIYNPIVLSSADSIPSLPSHQTKLQSQSSPYRLIPLPPEFKQNHAIHANLVNDKAIKTYHIYRSPHFSNNTQPGEDTTHLNGKEIVLADIHFGDEANGHKGIVHGGISSLLFDDAFGFGYFLATNGLMGFTANLNVNYRSPLPASTQTIMKIKLKQIDGRKVFLEGTLTSQDGKTLYCEATALYIIARGHKKLENAQFRKSLE